jgi:hypothetical protein
MKQVKLILLIIYFLLTETCLKFTFNVSTFLYRVFCKNFKWLPERPTFAVGMIVCGFGGGALIFNQVVTAYINPDNLSPDLETADGEKYNSKSI